MTYNSVFLVYSDSSLYIHWIKLDLTLKKILIANLAYFKLHQIAKMWTNIGY